MRESDSYFLQRLLDRQNEVKTLIAQGEEAARPVELDQSAVGRLSRMDAIQSQAMGVETQRRRRIELVRIGTALDRLRSEEFGDCVSCGEEISNKRLKHDPSMPTCIECARERG